MMQDLKNPRGEAACQRLLGMIAFDTGDLMRSREHALSASALYDQMGEPRGQVEASLLLAQGVPAKMVQELLGHSNITLTLGTYSHILPQLARDTAEKMNMVLAGGA